MPETYHKSTICSQDPTIPITLDEAKEHLRLTTNRLDKRVEAALAAAVEEVESESLAVRDVVVEDQYYSWPDDPVRFHRYPVKDIDRVEYVRPGEAAWTIIDRSAYRLWYDNAAAVLIWDLDALRSQAIPDIERMRIVYCSGYKDGIPALVRQAVLFWTQVYHGDLDEKQQKLAERAAKRLTARASTGRYRA